VGGFAGEVVDAVLAGRLQACSARTSTMMGASSFFMDGTILGSKERVKAGAL
jgi:hypothetical protein